MKKNQILFLHLLYWGLYLGNIMVKTLIFDMKYPAFEYSFFVLSFVCFYINYLWIVPRFFDIHKLYKIVIGYFISVFLFVLIRYTIEELFFPMVLGFRNYDEKTSLLFYFYDNIYFSGITIFVSTVFCLFRLMSKAEEEKRQLIEQKKNSELQALKTQINPHFIFNTLNNIYSLVYMQSEKALPAIEELGQLLRFSTKDLEKDYIPLEKEIEYLESLIQLEKLRIKNPELIIINKNIDFVGLKISPMLLIPFVENAFKHGDFRNKGINIKITVEDKNLMFQIHNFKNLNSKDSSSGIGIKNVKKRLEILYPKRHAINITENKTEFTVDLKIELRND